MNLDPNDARLTAHALGELTAAQAEAVEAAASGDATVRDSLEELRSLAETLTFAFAAAPEPGLTAEQHKAILSHHSSLTGSADKEARLTAYALGELRPLQADAISEALVHDRAAVHWVDDADLLAAALRAGFASEEKHHLTLEQREAVLAHRAPSARTAGSRVAPPPPFTRRASFRPWLGRAAAAAALIVLGWVVHGTDRSRPGSLSAVSDKPFPVLVPGGAAEAEPSFEALVALLEKERHRPSMSAFTGGEKPVVVAMNKPAEPGPALGPLSRPEVPLPPPLVQESPPRRRPDASALPPPATAPVSSRPASPAVPDMLTALAPRGFGFHSPSTHQPSFYDASATASAVLPADLGTASYDVALQCIRDFGSLPPTLVVRPEEIVNHFTYDVQPAPGQNVAVAIDAATCPWNASHQLVRVTVASRPPSAADRPPLHLTLFVRLAATEENERMQLLLWRGLKTLAGQLRSDDTVSLVAWGASRGIVLPPAPGWNTEALGHAIEHWHAGGPCPAGQSEWQAALGLARSRLSASGLHRVIVVTDGPLDFADAAALAPTVEAAAQSGVHVQIAQLGPRQPETASAAGWWRADSSAEASRLFAQHVFAPPAPVLEDVEIRLQFHPGIVHSWRPVGFRTGADSQGTPTVRRRWIAGRQVTALYEIVPLEGEASWPTALQGRFSRQASRLAALALGATPQPALSVSVSCRPQGQAHPVQIRGDWASSASDWRAASPDFRLAAAAGAYALFLNGDRGTENLSLSLIRDIAGPETSAHDPFGLRAEFLDLVEATQRVLRK